MYTHHPVSICILVSVVLWVLPCYFVILCFLVKVFPQPQALFPAFSEREGPQPLGDLPCQPPSSGFRGCALLLLFFNLFIYFWRCWVFVSVRGLSLVAASGGHSSSRCAGLSLSRPLLLRSTGSRRACSVVVAHGPSCSAACGIFPDQGSNPCPLRWQADSQPLRHQGSPVLYFLKTASPTHTR